MLLNNLIFNHFTVVFFKCQTCFRARHVRCFYILWIENQVTRHVKLFASDTHICAFTECEYNCEIQQRIVCRWRRVIHRVRRKKSHGFVLFLLIGFINFFPYFVQYFQKITLQSEKTVYSHQSQCMYNIYIILFIYNIYVYIYNIYIMYTFLYFIYNNIM